MAASGAAPAVKAPPSADAALHASPAIATASADVPPQRTPAGDAPQEDPPQADVTEGQTPLENAPEADAALDEASEESACAGDGHAEERAASATSAEPPAGASSQTRVRPVRPPDLEFDVPLTEFVVYDDDAELVYDEDEATIRAPSLPAGFEPDRVAVSRRVLYMQGFLLAAVALGSLVVGILIGRATVAPPVAEFSFPRPCLIAGSIAYQDEQGVDRPDRGAVAIVVPRDLRPETKINLTGLRPQDPSPSEDDPALQALRTLGGDYCRADVDGRFWLRVPDHGPYFVMFISAARSQQEDSPPREHLAQIGRFFRLDPNLFDGHAYVWREEQITSDRALAMRFP